MLLLKLCSLLTSAVMFTRAMPNDGLAIKCRLRDNVTASGGADGCASCAPKASQQTSTSCSSSASTRTFVSTTCVTTHAISSTSLVVVKSTPCATCQFTRTLDQNTSLDIPATQTKVSLSSSFCSVGTSS